MRPVVAWFGGFPPSNYFVRCPPGVSPHAEVALVMKEQFTSLPGGGYGLNSNSDSAEVLASSHSSRNAD